jgi:hypothetical protein
MGRVALSGFSGEGECRAARVSPAACGTPPQQRPSRSGRTAKPSLVTPTTLPRTRQRRIPGRTPMQACPPPADLSPATPAHQARDGDAGPARYDLRNVRLSHLLLEQLLAARPGGERGLCRLELALQVVQGAVLELSRPLDVFNRGEGVWSVVLKRRKERRGAGAGG